MSDDLGLMLAELRAKISRVDLAMRRAGAVDVKLVPTENGVQLVGWARESLVIGVEQAAKDAMEE